MPLNGPGDAYSIAYEINRGFFSWAWADHPGTNVGGPEPRAWQNPGNISVNVSALPTDEQNLVKQALALWHEVANVNFSYTTGSANITYTDNPTTVDPQGAHITTPTSLDAFGNRWITSATVNVPRDWTTGAGGGTAAGINSGYFQTLIHETGHALGLGHSGHYDGGGNTNTYYNTNSTIYANDTWQWTQMSYNDQTQYDGGTLKAVITPQIADIYAMQTKYGAATTRTGDTIYGFHSNAGPVYDFAGLGNDAPSMTIYDSGGTDTLDCSLFTMAQTIDLRGAGFLPGEAGFSSIGGAVHNVSIYLTSVIENAVGGSGADTIYGNDVANNIDGGAGSDTMSGGAGDDTYTVDSAGDVVIENANSGYDYVRCYINNYVLGANVEKLNYLGDPNANFTGIGNALDNYIIGWNGNDYLDGGAGADTFEGFGGNDTYVVDNAGDVTIENANAGYDEVLCYTTLYTLGANVEKLNYVGTSTANFTGIGNALDNLIIGWSGNDSLVGGAGADTMQGLGGNDTYYVDNVGDVVMENANAGTDTVVSSITFSLAALANVENLTLSGSANISGTGNSGVNILTGNSGNNVLDGQVGADTMIGGLGSDAYFVDNINDNVVENPGEGTDAVYVASGFVGGYYVLANNVENLYQLGFENITLYGNSLANYIQGNSGNNALNGLAGADVMAGGAGNDAYFVDSSFEVINENANEGTDAVYTTVSYALPANVEFLYLQGSANINGYGNALANYIVGNSGNNAIDGGAGADTMVGGLGSDAYFVDNSFDVITENLNEGFDAVYASMTYVLGANLENLYLQGTAVGGYGNGLANYIEGNAGDNGIDGRGGADVLKGNGGNDLFAFTSGEANGDTIQDFVGNGAALGDSIQFHGFGTAAQGATFMQINATQWQVHSGLDLHNEIINFSNAAAIHASDYSFLA